MALGPLGNQTIRSFKLSMTKVKYVTSGDGKGALSVGKPPAPGTGKTITIDGDAFEVVSKERIVSSVREDVVQVEVRKLAAGP